MIVFPNCKINLGLHVLNKREDGYHDLETVFFPLPLQDALEVIVSDTELEFTYTGLEITKGDSICANAYYLLKKHFKDLPRAKIHLHKTIPIGAGLGGGSADGSFTLLLLNKKLQLGLTEDQLMQDALQLGSDCPFFIKNKPCIATKRGEQLEEIKLDLSAYKIVLVNPQIHVDTTWAFSQVTPKQERSSIRKTIELPVTEWKHQLVNDFEEPVFERFPEIQTIKQHLYNCGAVYASMSGSGSTVYGIFKKEASPEFNFPSHYFIKLL